MALVLCLCAGALAQAADRVQVQVQLPPDAVLAPLMNEQSLFIFPLMNLVANNCPDTGLQPGDSHLLAAAGQRIVERMGVSAHVQRVVYLDAALKQIQQADTCAKFASGIAPVVAQLRHLGGTTQVVE